MRGSGRVQRGGRVQGSVGGCGPCGWWGKGPCHVGHVVELAVAGEEMWGYLLALSWEEMGRGAARGTEAGVGCRRSGPRPGLTAGVFGGDPLPAQRGASEQGRTAPRGPSGWARPGGPGPGGVVEPEQGAVVPTPPSGNVLRPGTFWKPLHRLEQPQSHIAHMSLGFVSNFVAKAWFFDASFFLLSCTMKLAAPVGACRHGEIERASLCPKHQH